MNDFSELRSRANHGLSASRSSSDTERLGNIITAIDLLKQNHNDYARRYGTAGVDENEILNEVEEKLLELLSE